MKQAYAIVRCGHGTGSIIDLIVIGERECAIRKMKELKKEIESLGDKLIWSWHIETVNYVVELDPLLHYRDSSAL